jgi:hypothetical protein
MVGSHDATRRSGFLRPNQKKAGASTDAGIQVKVGA